METLTVPEYPLQLDCQTLALQDPPRISPQISIILRLVKPTDLVDPSGTRNRLQKVCYHLSLIGPSETA